MRITSLRKALTLTTLLTSAVLVGSLQGQNYKPAAPATGDANSTTASNSLKPHDDSFQIGSDDVLAINVWKEPEISRSVPVRSDGKVSLPLVGEVQASGQTPKQLETEIAKKLTNYISEPEVMEHPRRFFLAVHALPAFQDQPAEIDLLRTNLLA
jgi:polysaccharide export outer membrane protein